MISAKMVLHSIDPRGNELKTLEVVMPRYILAEFNTHRMLSRNSASSRAIPFKKMVQSVIDNTFVPYAWQKDHKGMQGTEYQTNQDVVDSNIAMWLNARDEAINYSSILNDDFVTKQLANRLLEPFMYHKVLVSGTEWDNFFNLRCPEYQSGYKVGSSEEKDYKIHKSWKDLYTNFVLDGVDSKICQTIKENSILEKLQVNKGQADIHMMFLAEAIWDATNESTPIELKEGEWHIPYGDQMNVNEINDLWLLTGVEDDTNEEKEKLEIIRKISVARCARLSYQTLGDNPVIDYEADLKLYDVLAKSGHYSPFEHVARVMTEDEYFVFVKGKMPISNYSISAPTKDMQGWCLNFKGFIQERYLLEQTWKG